MVHVGNNQRRPQRVHSVLELDFRKGFCEEDFNMMLGSDGCHTSDGDGLTINSSLFQESQPVGGDHGWLDHHKWCAYYKSPVDINCSKETLFEAKIANKQIFDESNPVPVEFRGSVTDMCADPRLAHGQFTMLDPESGLYTGFMLTDHVLYAVYGRNSALRICNYKNCYADECEPCATKCDDKYGCADFWQDCRYQDFKQNTTEAEFRRFVEYCAWKEFTDKNSVALSNFKIFCNWRKQNPINCDALTRQDYVAWKSHYDWQEYCAFQAGWREWHRQYVDWECCAEDCLPSACQAGECSRRAFGESSSSCSSCFHVYTRDGKNCYDKGVSRTSEDWSYQFGACRSCCNTNHANFCELVPVLRTEACDPLCDFIKVCVGIDRKYKTIKYYVNNQEVFKVVDAGRRLNDMYRVIEHGGYADSIDVKCMLVSFGTGSLLDASMPNNYSRYHAKNNNKDETALVPLMPVDKYASVYFNKAGELRPVESSHFAVVSPELKYRTFRQGDVMKIQYVCVMVRPASRDYTSLRSYCSFRTCCGANGSADCRDCCEEDDCCGGDANYGPCGVDERDFDVEFIREGNRGPVVGDTLEPIDTGCESKSAVRARLVRTPKTKRYWQPNCADEAWGSNPYM